ncbi:MAG: TetR/AcrR family transcriptional regulator [Bacteroidetes bacterium]|nr:TetR/AcrR family transcriptional regulator [Bacteroidota bacterium]MBL0063537.1 TetR/AcrR family transcriptional regulator [Bacteroidota bacterium]MBL0140036.1 TetR/AcrR family transcriptional regulator [Bacteroidota bacterium]
MVRQEDRILDTSKELFFRHGIKSITMDDIAHKLGMSKKTIYQYYADKNAILSSLMISELKSQIREMQEIRKNSENSIDEMLQSMSCMSKNFSKMNPTLFYDLQKYHSSAWGHFKNFKEKELTGFVEENLRRGIKSELYRKDLKVKTLARLRLEEVELGFNTEAFPHEQFNISEVQVALLEHFLYGVVTLKGYKLINKYRKIQDEE